MPVPRHEGAYCYAEYSGPGNARETLESSENGRGRLSAPHNNTRRINKALVGKVEIEQEWRSRLAAATCSTLEHTTTTATSMELFKSAFFPINRDTLATESGRSVRILNPTFAGGTWTIGQEASPENLIRFTTTTALPALMDSNPRTPIPIDYKGTTATLENLLEFFDPQNKTIIRVEIDYPLLGSMLR